MILRTPTPVGMNMKQGLALTTFTDDHDSNLQALFEVCYALREVNLSFLVYVGHILGSIPSNSVAIIRIHNPMGITGTTYNSCWGWSPGKFESHLSNLEDIDIPEYERLGVSIREIAQRFSEHHRGSKTRVQVIYQPTEIEAQAIDDGETPFFMTKLEEELGTSVVLELNLLPFVPDIVGW